MPRILVVESNPRHREAASSYFREGDIPMSYALDHDSAVVALPGKPRYDGVYISVFLPRRIGSGDTDLGRTIVNRLASVDTEERRIRGVLNRLDPYIEIDDKLRPIIRDLAANPSAEIVITTIINNSKVCGKAKATEIVQETFKETSNRCPEYYDEMEKAIAKSEENQPLGFLVAEKAEQLGIPFVLGSLRYRGDPPLQKVFERAILREWGEIVDCDPESGDEKATPKYWHRAFNALQVKMPLE